MTYTFPPSLQPLHDYLRALGADTIAFASARQAAFMAQQLLGTRVKFPEKGSDMTSTLFLIQKAVTEGKALKSTADQILRNGKKPKGNAQKQAKSNKHHRDFSPSVFAEGIHIFCDGAAVPNPGAGGWGVVVYRDGEEVDSAHGGQPEATNNVMEMTALLVAIEKSQQLLADSETRILPITIWCDSQYCVKGVNEWRHGWKKNGWARGGQNAEPKNRILANADLWKAIDEATESVRNSVQISIRWVKGHANIAGNERADELAEMGRQEAIEKPAYLRSYPDQAENLPLASPDDLDERYRQIMGAM